MIHIRSDDSEIKCAGYKGSKTSILFSNLRFDLDLIANIFLIYVISFMLLEYHISIVVGNIDHHH